MVTKFKIWRQGGEELFSASCSFMGEIRRQTDADKETHQTAGVSGDSGTVVGPWTTRKQTHSPHPAGAEFATLLLRTEEQSNCGPSARRAGGLCWKAPQPADFRTVPLFRLLPPPLAVGLQPRRRARRGCAFPLLPSSRIAFLLSLRLCAGLGPPPSGNRGRRGGCAATAGSTSGPRGRKSRGVCTEGGAWTPGGRRARTGSR